MAGVNEKRLRVRASKKAFAVAILRTFDAIKSNGMICYIGLTLAGYERGVEL